MWIDANDRLPAPGRRVPVAGDHTPPGTGHPQAYRRADPGARQGWRWESTEWRGQVAVHHWWDEPQTEG